MDWNNSLEELLESLADESKCRAKLHSQLYESFARRHTYLNLPIIVLSTICASANFFSGYLKDATIERYVIISAGFVNIITSALSSVGTYLKLGANSESHRLAQLAWQKFYNEIIFNLSLTENYRENGTDLLHTINAQYNRLFEISPALDSGIIKKLKRKLVREKDDHFKLPHYLNGCRGTRSYGQEEDDYKSNESN